jgi:hypothetical protein
MAERRGTPQAFMSYKSCDKDFVVRLARDLRSHGIKAWLDDWSMPPGESLTDAMERGIEESDVMLLVLTPASVAAIRHGTGGVAFEVHIGEDRRFTDSHFRMIGILRKSCHPPSKLRNRLGRWLDFQDDTQYLRRLNELVRWIRDPDGDLGPLVGTKATSAPIAPLLDAALVADALGRISYLCAGLIGDLSEYERTHRGALRERLVSSVQELLNRVENFLVDFSRADDGSRKVVQQRFLDFLHATCRHDVGRVAERFANDLMSVASLGEGMLGPSQSDATEHPRTINVILSLSHDAALLQAALIAAVDRGRREIRRVEDQPYPDL